jgi:hypothetical protein
MGSIRRIPPDYIREALLLPPIYLHTSLGTIHDGLALSAVVELDIRRCYSSAGDAAPEHESCWSEVK